MSDYARYFERRGYDLGAGSAALLRRAFLECWREPGFHAFWRVWNPVYGYFLFRFYRLIGGRRTAPMSSLVVFSGCGFLLHDLIAFGLTGRRVLVCTFAVLVFALLGELSRRFAARQARWPGAVHVVLNLGQVAFGFLVGIWLSHRLVSA